MAQNDDLMKGVAIGIGVTLLAPVVATALVPVVRPLARSALKAGVLVYEKGREAWEVISETVEDVVAEVERYFVMPGQACALGRALILSNQACTFGQSSGIARDMRCVWSSRRGAGSTVSWRKCVHVAPGRFSLTLSGAPKSRTSLSNVAKRSTQFRDPLIQIAGPQCFHLCVSPANLLQ